MPTTTTRPTICEHGTFRVHVASNQVQLAQFQSLVKTRPGLRGVLTLNADAAGQVAGDVQLTALNANAGVRGLEMEGKRLGDLTATAATAGTGRPVQRELGFRRLHDPRERPLAADRQARHHGHVRRSPTCPSTAYSP